MAFHVALQDPKTGELRQIKVGWNWVLFFFAGVAGIPLFTRKLFAWGCVFLALNVAALTFKIMGDKTAVFSVLVFVLQVALACYVATKGNQMNAKALLVRGWRFLEPTSEMTRFAKMKWQIFDTPDAVLAAPNLAPASTDQP